MSGDPVKTLPALLLLGAALLAQAQVQPAEPVRLGELTIGRLAALQQQLLEQELARKFTQVQPDAGLVRGATLGDPAAAPVALAPAPPRTITLLGLVAVAGVVRQAELLLDGAVIGAAVGQVLSGWRLEAITPQQVRLARGRSAVVLRPGDSMEVR